MSIAGIFDTFSNAFGKGKKTERHEFLRRLSSYSDNQLANVILSIMVGSTVELTLGVSLCIRLTLCCAYRICYSPHECAQCVPGVRSRGRFQLCYFESWIDGGAHRLCSRSTPSVLSIFSLKFLYIDSGSSDRNRYTTPWCHPFVHTLCFEHVPVKQIVRR